MHHFEKYLLCAVGIKAADWFRNHLEKLVETKAALKED